MASKEDKPAGDSDDLSFLRTVIIKLVPCYNALNKI